MFKKCNMCMKSWDELNTFLADKDLHFCGYQASPDDPAKGLFLFNHIIPDCQTTLAIKVGLFQDGLNQKIHFKRFQPHGEGCPGFCANEDNLQSCPNTACNGRVIRELIQKIKEMSDKKIA